MGFGLLQIGMWSALGTHSRAWHERSKVQSVYPDPEEYARHPGAGAKRESKEENVHVQEGCAEARLAYLLMCSFSGGVGVMPSRLNTEQLKIIEYNDISLCVVGAFWSNMSNLSFFSTSSPKLSLSGGEPPIH